jgi:hypothetical protein
VSLPAGSYAKLRVLFVGSVVMVLAYRDLFTAIRPHEALCF